MLDRSTAYGIAYHPCRKAQDKAPADDLQRLVRAYALCDTGARAEVIAIAERLSGTAP